MAETQHRILLGTDGSGLLHTAHFGPKQGTFEEEANARVCERPGWQIRHPTIADIFYSTSHTDHSILCLRLERDGSVTVLDKALVNGTNPVHMAFLQDPDAIIVANYGHSSAGNVAVMPISPDGRFLRDDTDLSLSFSPPLPSLPHSRQQTGHPHQILVYNGEILIPDLGSNVIWRMERSSAGKLSVRDQIKEFEDGDGPRNLALHPSGKYMYVLNEISNTLSVHTFPENGPSTVLSRYPIQPPNARHEKDMIGGQICLLPRPEGQSYFLLCTNRNSIHEKGDAIAVFMVQGDGSVVEPYADQAFLYLGLEHIRALQIDTSQRYVLTAGRDGGGCRILEVDSKGGIRLAARSDIDRVISALWLI